MHDLCHCVQWAWFFRTGVGFSLRDFQVVIDTVEALVLTLPFSDLVSGHSDRSVEAVDIWCN